MKQRPETLGELDKGKLKYCIFDMVWSNIGFRGLLIRFNIGGNGRQMILAEYQKRPLSNIQPQPMVGVDFNSHFKSGNRFISICNSS